MSELMEIPDLTILHWQDSPSPSIHLHHWQRASVKMERRWQDRVMPRSTTFIGFQVSNTSSIWFGFDSLAKDRS